MAENYETWLARQHRLEASGVECPDCGEPMVSKAGIRAHKGRGSCVPVRDTGARDRMADLIARALEQLRA